MSCATFRSWNPSICQLGEPLQISTVSKDAQLKSLSRVHEVIVVANLAAKSVEPFRATAHALQTFWSASEAAVQRLLWRKEVPSEVSVPQVMSRPSKMLGSTCRCQKRCLLASKG